MTAITRDEVWEMFREVARRFEESDRKLTQRFEETDRQFKETDRQFKETDRQFKETDRKLAQQSAETDHKIKAVTTAIGQLGNRLGEFVEGLVKPAVVRLFRERGIEVHEVHRDLSGQRDGVGTQVDLLVVDDGVCVVVEVKSRLSVDDVNEHTERMSKFKRVFPRYNDIQAHGAVAAMVIPDDVASYAYRQGFFVIGQKGETVEILNDDKFQPAVW